MPLSLLPQPAPVWHELTRSAVAKHVSSAFAEECYVGLVAALAEQADLSRAVPKNVSVAFVRAPGRWQKDDVPTPPPLMVKMQATYNGEVYDYSALLPDEYDPDWLRRQHP